MSLTESTLFKLSDQQISSDLAGEKVILNHKKGAYYALDEVGALVWGELEKGEASFIVLKERVLESYDVDPDVLDNDLMELLKELVAEKLVETVV
jgi:hypothetical protein